VLAAAERRATSEASQYFQEKCGLAAQLEATQRLHNARRALLAALVLNPKP
jgi:hypothetical protein